MIQILDDARDGVSSLKVLEHEVLTGSVPQSHWTLKLTPQAS